MTSPLTVTADVRYHRAALLTLRGELDLSGLDMVSAAVAAAVAAGARFVLVDLHHLTFLDMAGTGTLLRCRASAATAGVDMRITGARGAVRRVLDLVGVGPLLDPDWSPALRTSCPPRHFDSGHRPARTLAASR